MNINIRWLRKKFKIISWQNKYIKYIIYSINIPDWVLRKINKLDHLPKYSIRVRSNGVQGQFGGTRFAYVGELTIHLLKKHTNLKPESKVIEIGCGCGRNAFALNTILDNGNYNGMDVDEVSIAACKTNKVFKNKNFEFKHMDIYNFIYNPKGEILTDSFKFPYADKSADIIFLVSVFTHMLPHDVIRYINEISRMLRPGGYFFFSTFLMDNGHQGRSIDFPYDHSYYRFHLERIPEKAIGYYQSFLINTSSKAGMSLNEDPILGGWRSLECSVSLTDFGQDILVLVKDKEKKS